ncbi:MAG: IreB family regulatory phosphoprotein [Eubacteriaceae bacterium]
MDNNTVRFTINSEREKAIQDIIKEVNVALIEKGYNPINQLLGYIMSGDPTYITSHNGARALISKVERDELIEEFIKAYLNLL